MKLYKKEAASGAANTESGQKNDKIVYHTFSLDEFLRIVKPRRPFREGAIA